MTAFSIAAHNSKPLALFVMATVFFVLFGWFFPIPIAFLYALNVFFDFEADAKDILFTTALMVAFEVSVNLFGWMIGGLIIVALVGAFVIKAARYK